MLRRCFKCQREFPATLEYFPRAQQGRLRTDCKTCNAESHAEQYQRSRAKRDQVNREWIKAHPEARRAHVKKYADNNKDKTKAAARAWFENDPARARAINTAKTKRWYQRHLEHARSIRRTTVKKRKALKKGAGSATLTRHEWESIKARYKNCCAYCGKRGRMTQDHITPLSKGGHHSATNVVPACMTCNCSKKAGPPPCPVQPMLFA